MRKPYIIFDRDGTLIKHVHHLSKLEQVIIFDDVPAALQEFQSYGFSFGIITNQSVIGRGLATSNQVSEINSFISSQLLPHDIHFDFMLVCPHVPEDGCRCRKPQPELGELAIAAFQIDMKESFVIGDQVSDLDFARNLGLKSFLVRNEQVASTNPHKFFPDLLELSKYMRKGQC